MSSACYVLEMVILIDICQAKLLAASFSPSFFWQYHLWNFFALKFWVSLSLKESRGMEWNGKRQLLIVFSKTFLILVCLWIFITGTDNCRWENMTFWTNNLTMFMYFRKCTCISNLLFTYIPHGLSKTLIL